MDLSFAEDLYSGSLQLPKADPISDSAASVEHNNLDDGDDFWGEDGDDLERESRNRYHHFFTIGYREGVIAGQEASAQEGFNVGFKQSVLTGFNWGLVRGVTSALSFLPDELKQKMIETQEKRDKFQGLYESVHSLSTSDAVNFFSDDISSGKITLPREDTEGSMNQGSDQSLESGGQLAGYIGELKSVLLESPKITTYLDASSVP